MTNEIKRKMEMKWKVLVSKSKIYIKPRNFLKSSVLNTLITDCSLNLGSLDQIAQFILSNFNASANMGRSLSCASCLASDSNCLDFSSGIIERNFANSSKVKFICSDGSLEYFEIEDLISNNSFQQCSGEYNFSLSKSELTIMNLTGFSLKNDINMLVSTTNCIYQPSFFNFFQAFCFTSLPNLKQSSSVNSEFSNILSSFLSNNILLTLSDKKCLTNADQFVSGDLSISFFSSFGIDKVKLGILPPLNSVYSVEDKWLFKSFGRVGGNKFERLSSVGSDDVDIHQTVLSNNNVNFSVKKWKNI